MSNNDNKLISLEHLNIVKQYIDTKCGDLGDAVYTTDQNVKQNTHDISVLKNKIDGFNINDASFNINEIKNRIAILESCGTGFDELGIGVRFKSLDTNINDLDTRITTLENKTSNDAGITESTGNINANTLINMINSSQVLNGVLTIGSNFGTGVLNFVKSNGFIKASNIDGTIPASKINGTIPASKINGTFDITNLPTIPFYKIDNETFGVKLNTNKTIESNNGLWILSGDGSGKISESFKWDSLGNFTIGNNLISWSQLADETIPNEIIEKIKAQIGGTTGGTDSLDMQNLQNNYFGNLIGYRIDKNGQNIINDKNEIVKTTVSELLGDKIGVLEYNTASGKVNVDADGKPIVTTVSSVIDDITNNVIGDVTGAKAVYDSNNKMTGVEYDKDISVAAKFEEIEKNWIGKSFKPEFEVKSINGVSSASQTTQTVSDVFNEIKTDWIGEGIKPAYSTINNVTSRTSQNIEEILNEIKIDWLGTSFLPKYDKNIRSTDNVSDVINDIKHNWLGPDINTNNSVTSKLSDLLNKIQSNASAIGTHDVEYRLLRSDYDKFSSGTNARFETINSQLKNMNDTIIGFSKTLVGSLDIENVATIVDVAINDGRLNVYTRNEADALFALSDTLNNHISHAETIYETKANIEDKFKEYLKTSDLNNLNAMLNSISIVSQTWYQQIKNAILDICDDEYAPKSVADGLSNYALKSELTNGTISVKKASSADYATSATLDGNSNNIASTYVTKTTYNQLVNKYDTLKSDYDKLLARVVALENKAQ